MKSKAKLETQKDQQCILKSVPTDSSNTWLIQLKKGKNDFF